MQSTIFPAFLYEDCNMINQLIQSNLIVSAKTQRAGMSFSHKTSWPWARATRRKFKQKSEIENYADRIEMRASTARYEHTDNRKVRWTGSDLLNLFQGKHHSQIPFPNAICRARKFIREFRSDLQNERGI